MHKVQFTTEMQVEEAAAALKILGNGLMEIQGRNEVVSPHQSQGGSCCRDPAVGQYGLRGKKCSQLYSRTRSRT